MKVPTEKKVPFDLLSHVASCLWSLALSDKNASLTKGSLNYSPWATSGPKTVFVNKVLLEAQSHLFISVLAVATFKLWTELSSCQQEADGPRGWKYYLAF